MRASVFVKSKKGVELREIETPKADGYRTIIGVEASGICGSDISACKKDYIQDGTIFGHEYAGTVVDPGAAEGLRAGDRVTVNPTNNCGDCPECRRGGANVCRQNITEFGGQGQGTAYPGGHAEYVSALPYYVRKIPDHMSFEQGAMVEPTAVCLHGVHLSGIRAGDRVLITGAGLIAVLSAILARRQGASFIAVSARTPEKAKMMVDGGFADAVFDSKDPDHIKQLAAACGGTGYDAVLECTGSLAILNVCIAVARPASRIVLLGIGSSDEPFRFNRVSVKELFLVGSICYSAEEFDRSIELVASGDFDLMPFVTRRIGLSAISETFEQMLAHKTNDIKVMIDPSK